MRTERRPKTVAPWGTVLVAAVAVGAACLLARPAPAADDPDSGAVVKLFNGKDLSNWTIYVDPKVRGYSAESSGDPSHIFKVEDGVIHVSGERFAGITTRDEYENYRLTLEFRWGKKKWPPRDKPTDKRDSGVLLHCVGPEKIWPRSIECQIQEGDCGDFWMVDGTTIRVGGRLEGGYSKKKKDAEKPSGEWNTIEVVCDGAKITNIVNGVVVNEGTEASVTKGRILLQSEGAEVFYRKVELRPIRAKDAAAP